MPLPKGIDALPSGRYRARFTSGGKSYAKTWDTPKQAAAWMARTRRELALGIHEDSPADDPETGKPVAPILTDYATNWIDRRDVKESTRRHYRDLYRQHIDPKLGRHHIDKLTPAMVTAWHSRLLPGSPTRRSQAYRLLRTILGTAMDEDIIPANPCRVKGASSVKRSTRTDLPTVAQVSALADAMPTPKYRNLVLLSAWTGLRFGEATELRRKDLVLGADGELTAVKVRRAVYRGAVTTPKSHAGIRDIVVPPHIRVEVGKYVNGLPNGPEILIFPATRRGSHMKAGSLYKPFYKAREKVGLPTLRWHDLRHFSATAAARTGASLAELQQRLGHSTVTAAMRYQHAAQGRDAEIADAMSRLA